MSKLHGWQRLWVVLSVLWVLAMAFKATADPPSKERDRDFWLNSALLEVPEMKVKPWDTYACRDKIDKEKHANPYLAQLECEQASVNPTKEVKDRFDLAILRGEKDIADSYPEKYIHYYGVWAAICFVPVILLYAAGWVVAWVVRGFRKQAT